MKQCPNCLSVFDDNTYLKCTNCGTDLIEKEQEQPIYSAPPHSNYNAYNSQFKLCPNCGNYCDPRAVICVKCGIQFTDNFNKPRVDDNPSPILKVLCFFIPILGLILFILNNNEKPISAKAYGKLSLIGFIVGIIAYVVVIGLSIAMALLSPNTSVYPLYPDNEIFYSIINNIF